MKFSHEYDVSCLPLGDLSSLEAEWQAIERESENTFFLSWVWMKSWIEAFNPRVEVLKVSSNGELVAIALIVLNKEQRFGILNSMAYHFHQTGDPIQDQIWIEYNNFLTKKDHHEAAVAAGLRFLIDDKEGWDELIIGAMTEDDVDYFKSVCKFSSHTLWDAPAYGVDLKTIREHDKDYLSTLSRNTRYQIRRSIRKYQEEGILKLEAAETLEQVLDYFAEIGPLHIERWGLGLGGSGFANNMFINFHHILIRNGWQGGHINILRLMVGEKPIAYFYNFIYKKKIYFYLSGMGKVNDSMLKPGMVGHSLAIQKFLEKGLDYYDFMGGDERYKMSLGSKKLQLFKISFKKNQCKFRAEDFARKIKRYFLRG